MANTDRERRRVLARYARVGAGVWLVLIMLTGLPSFGLGQEIRSRDVLPEFTKARPQPATEKKSSPYRKRPAYRLTSRPSVVVSHGSTVGQIGVTVWRLRPAQKTDKGARMLVPGDRRDFTMQRTTVDTPIRLSDEVRLGIESARPGYLYIVDRDLFADGLKGSPKLIYPTRKTLGDGNQGGNRVRPGILIDIPQGGVTFKVNPSSGDQVGELLNIIVTAAPLDLPLSDDAIEISQSQLAQWEKQWGGGAERFEMVGGTGRQWTNEEKAAFASASAQPLSQSGPTPQTIYRVPAGSESGVMVSVTLRYSRSKRFAHGSKK